MEAQIFQNEKFLIGRRFDERMDPPRRFRELAITRAEEERKALER